MHYNDIINFWFDDKNKRIWFKSSTEDDEKLKEKFQSVYNEAKNLKLVGWQTEPLGSLALVIILDQFPLNMFRGKPQSFATEVLSREIAEQAINQGFDAELSAEQKAFLYMPYMHSENMDDQEQSLILFNQQGLEENYRFAQHHYNIVKQFGRFPHRNKILGRESTAEEQAYLNSDKAFLG